jgi:hypothetical protein
MSSSSPAVGDANAKDKIPSLIMREEMKNSGETMHFLQVRPTPSHFSKKNVFFFFFFFSFFWSKKKIFLTPY